MREAGAPTALRARRAWRPRSVVLCAGHRPEHALTDDRMGGANDVGGDAGSASGKNLRRRLDVESADQCGEAGSVEVMHRGSRGGQLDGMAALGGQVQIGPCDDVLVGVRGKSPQAKSPQHPTETDLDADQFEAVVGACE